MDNKKTLAEIGWEWISRLAIVGVVALATFCFKMNAEINSITDNKEDICNLAKTHEADKDNLWRKYSEVKEREHELLSDIAVLKTEVRHLKEKLEKRN